METRTVYKRIKLLGRGSYGSAWLVQANNGEGLYVLKIINLANLPIEVKVNAVLEARILEDLCHVNIVRFREVYRTEENELCIVMEYAEGGDLSKIVRCKKGSELRLEEKQILAWVGQLASAISYIHSKKIIHRDVKPQNIFLTKDNQIKLGDFGISKVLNFTGEHAQTLIGTPYYMSPEIVGKDEYQRETDIWALGVVTYELCTGRLPFGGLSLGALSLAIATGNYSPIPSYYSPELHALVRSMLEVDPKKRISADQILNFLGFEEQQQQQYQKQQNKTKSDKNFSSDKHQEYVGSGRLLNNFIQRAKSAKVVYRSDEEKLKSLEQRAHGLVSRSKNRRKLNSPAHFRLNTNNKIQNEDSILGANHLNKRLKYHSRNRVMSDNDGINDAIIQMQEQQEGSEMLKCGYPKEQRREDEYQKDETDPDDNDRDDDDDDEDDEEIQLKRTAAFAVRAVQNNNEQKFYAMIKQKKKNKPKPSVSERRLSRFPAKIELDVVGIKKPLLPRRNGT